MAGEQHVTRRDTELITGAILIAISGAMSVMDAPRVIYATVAAIGILLVVTSYAKDKD